jgi:hypothetical protein
VIFLESEIRKIVNCRVEQNRVDEYYRSKNHQIEIEIEIIKLK